MNHFTMRISHFAFFVLTAFYFNCTPVPQNTSQGIPSNYSPLRIRYYVVDQEFINGNLQTVNIIVHNDDGFHSKLPEVTNKIEPLYPSIAVRAGVEGTVKVRATINSQGKTVNVIILESEAELFNDSVLDAVRQWVFSPLYYKGVATVGYADIPISFVISGHKGKIILPE